MTLVHRGSSRHGFRLRRHERNVFHPVYEFTLTQIYSDDVKDTGKLDTGIKGRHHATLR